MLISSFFIFDLYLITDDKCALEKPVGLINLFAILQLSDNSDSEGNGCTLCYNFFQAVSIVEGKKSVDVGVSLCYCNSDLCNQVIMDLAIMIVDHQALMIMAMMTNDHLNMISGHKRFPILGEAFLNAFCYCRLRISPVITSI